MAALREVLARFGVSFDDRELKKGDKAVDGLSGKLSKLGGLLAGGLVLNGLKNMFFGLTEQADALAKQSSALGISIDQLQEWQHAAVLSGSSAEEFGSAFTKFNKNVVDAAKGTGPAADALRKLGVNVRDSAGKLGAPIDLLDGVADGLAKIQNPAERTEAAMSLFGKSGAKLLPLFNQGAEGIAKLRAEVQDLGGGFSPDFAKRSEDMNDAITRLNLAWLSFKVRVGGLVIPTIERFVVVATKVTSAVTKWADKTKILSEQSNLAAGAAVVLGAAFLVAGLKAIAPWLPMLALFAGLILLVDELITLWEGGDTIIGRAIDSIFGEGSAKKATEWVKSVVTDIRAFFLDTEASTAELKAGLGLIFFDLGAATVGVATSIEDAFAKAWNAILSGAQDALGKVGDLIEKIPGGRAIVEKFVAAQSSLEGAKASAGNRAEADADAAQGRRYLLDQADAAQQRQREARRQADFAAVAAAYAKPATATATVPASQTVNAPVEVNVTVPPGTPAQQARAVGEAARKGVETSNKAKFNALVKTAG